MDLVSALATSIGLLGGLVTFLFLSPFGLGLQVPAAFIAWASFYHCGGKLAGLKTTLASHTWGVLIAALTLIALTKSGLPDIIGLPAAAGIIVGLGTFVVILGAKLPGLSAVPANVYGFAATAWFTLLTSKADMLLSPTLENPAIIVALSMAVGSIFGYISEKLVGVLVKS